MEEGASVATPSQVDVWVGLDRRRAEGKCHNAALMCLARRRCDVILAILRTRQPYQAGQSQAAGLIAA